jgi:hypothetical protein
MKKDVKIAIAAALVLCLAVAAILVQSSRAAQQSGPKPPPELMEKFRKNPNSLWNRMPMPR